MPVRNLVFLRNLLSKPKAFGTAIFWACCFSSVFGSFVLEICVSPKSLGGGVPPDAQDLHPQHHQDYLVAMNLSLSFADTSGVLLFQAMLELACSGFG